MAAVPPAGKSASAARTVAVVPAPATVLVDCTPMLPGGSNGGAKILTLTLLSELCRLAPGTRFVLLLRRSLVSELDAWQAPNLTLQVVLDDPRPGPSAPTRSGQRARAALWRRLIPDLPSGLRLALRLRQAARRQRARPLLQHLGGELLFCPFTAPTYHRPDLPTVCTVHDLQYLSHPDFFSAAERAARDFAFREACRRADRLVAISEFTRSEVARASPGAAARVRTILIRTARRSGGTDAAADATALDALGLQAQAYFLYPANFWRHKNHRMLLEAFAQARQRGLNRDLRLVLTGTGGSEEARVRTRAAQADLQDRVVFAGFLPSDTLATVLRAAQAMVFPSLHEGFGMPVIEAMAAGTPVICSRSSSLPEVAGGAAWLCDPEDPGALADALLALAGDAALRARLAAQGRQQAAGFCDPERMAREYWAVFLEACAGRLAGSADPPGLAGAGRAAGEL